MKKNVIQTLKQTLNIKAIVELQSRVRKLAKKEPKMYKEAPNVDKSIVSQAADLKAKIDVMESQLKALYEDYNPLRQEILDFLPGTPIDKVETLIDGVQIKKWSQVRGAGQLDQAKALKLIKEKKLLGALTTKIVVVDEDALALAVYEGLIAEKEYASLLTEGSVSEVLKIERKFEVKVDKPINQEDKEVG